MQATINGNMICFDDGGTGAPILLIHGFPLNRSMWRPQQQVLERAGFRPVIPDLRGFGESTASEGMTIGAYADDLIGLLDHLGIERAAMAGMSMGGYILLDLLERYPDRCSAACFVVTRSGDDDEAGKARRQALARDAQTLGPQVVADAFAKVLFAPGTQEADPDLAQEVYSWMAETPTLGLVGGLLAMRERKDYTPVLRSVSLPSLVIGAEEDQAIPPDNSRLLAQSIPDATLCLIPKAGHLVNLEQPEAFNSCLLKFLERLKTP